MPGVAVTVNGESHPADDIAAHTSALDWLRSIGLTGAKEGCAEGECGACSVLVAKPEGDGVRWTALNSCLVPAAALDGVEVITAEGLGRADRLHPCQQELAMRGGSQCGYCTPGFVCSMAAEYYRPDRQPAPVALADDVKGTPVIDHETGPTGFDLHALSGNLCRCTGYRPIRDAAYALGQPAPDDPLARRRSQSAPPAPTTSLQGDSGHFVRPGTLAEALDLLAAHPGAVLLGGSTDWGVEVNLRHRRAELTIALDALDELRSLDVGTDRIAIGACLSLSEIERGLQGQVPLLDQLWPQFASRLIRNGATLGGNLGTASPIGDCAPALLALEASLVLASSHGEREVALADYFTGYRETVKAPDELIKTVLIPTPVAAHAAFYKIAKRRFDDISSVAIAIAARFDGTSSDTNRSVANCKIGLGGVAATPVRARQTEDALTGMPWQERTVSAAAEILGQEGTPMDDHRASAAYRSAMLRQSLLRFFADTAPNHGQGER